MEGRFVFYLELFRALEAHKVRYLLVGGLAMNLHGVPRMTMDVDVVLALDDANLDAFIDAVTELGLKPQLPLPLERIKDSDSRREWIAERNMIAFSLIGDKAPVPTVDILIHHPLDFDKAYDNAEIRHASGVSIRLTNIDDMIRLKEFSGRKQDLSDIEMLREFKGEEQ